MRRNRRRMFVVMLCVAAFSFMLVPATYAAEHYPACNNAGALKTAVNNANTNGEDDTIGLAGEGCIYDLSATLVIKNDGVLTIEGNGAIISGVHNVRVIKVEPDATLILNNVIIRHGKADGDGPDRHGGGIYNDYGIVTLNNSTVYENTAIFGSGIYSRYGTLNVNASTISDNTGVVGGGIFSAGAQTTLANSVVIGNTTTHNAAGIMNNFSGELTVTGSGIAYNAIIGDGEYNNGGGIYNDARLTVTNSSIYGNTAGGGGGGGGGILNNGTAAVIGSYIGQNGAVYGAGIWNLADKILTVANTTFYANTSGQYGGGIDNDGKLKLTTSTLFGNSAVNAGGNLLNYNGASLTMQNTILAGSGSSGGDCINFPNGVITAESSHNLMQNNSCVIANSLSGDPRLGNLTGAPGYFPLLADSPAIDAGTSFNCAPTDQRGADRPQDGDGDGSRACDIGAYEADTVPVTPPEEVELLVNGGFEAKTSTNTPQLIPWKLANASGDKIRCNTPTQTVAFEGTCAMLLKGGTKEKAMLRQNAALAGQTFAAGDKLRLSLRVKAPNAAVNGKVILSVSYGGAAPTQTVNVPLAKTTGYAELTKELTLQNGNPTQIRLQINHKSLKGNVYVDAVSLVQVKTPPTVQPLELIPLPQAPADMRSNGL